MHDRPEKAARAKREEKRKGKQPRITELLRINESAGAAQDERDHPEQQRQTRVSSTLEIFALRRWRVAQSFAHFFGASGLAGGFASAGLLSAALFSPGLFSGGLFSPGLFSPALFSGGLFSAGFSRSPRCSGGTSATVAPWLRWSARR